MSVASSHPVLVLNSVGKIYSQGPRTISALDQVSLSIVSGTIQGIIGFSGAGKSTLLRCLSRLEKPEQGHITIAGEDLATLEGEALQKARRRIGVVFQNLHLLHSRTVEQNISLPLELASVPPSEIKERVRELLSWFGLEELATQRIAQLSGGQRQRVAIARGLALKPAVLLADEPTSALDPETTASALRLLRRVRDELGVTIVLITHEIDAVRAICDRVAVLEHGRVVEEGPVSEILHFPRNQATKRLLTPSSELLNGITPLVEGA